MNFRLVIDWSELNVYDSAALEHAQEYVSRLRPIYPLGPVVNRGLRLERWDEMAGTWIPCDF